MSKSKIFSDDLNIDLESKKETAVFKWFLVCLLFGKPIQQEIAKQAYFELEKEKLLTPDKIIHAGWDKLVKILDNAHYVRYDYSTATKLLTVCRLLKEKYGTLNNLYKKAEDKQDLVRRLTEFPGVGEKTVDIFLRDMQKIWPKAA